MPSVETPPRNRLLIDAGQQAPPPPAVSAGGLFWAGSPSQEERPPPSGGLHAEGDLELSVSPGLETDSSRMLVVKRLTLQASDLIVPGQVFGRVKSPCLFG